MVRNSTFNEPNNGNGIADDGECRKTLSTYAVATGCAAQLFDTDFKLLEVCGKVSIEQKICPHCTGFTACRAMHINAIREACRQGKPVIYRCELGLAFWSCPMFYEKKCSGILHSSGYVNDKADPSIFAAKCNGTITPEEFAARISAFPSCGDDRIESLAEILLLCAESLSKNSKRFHETLRRRSEQTAVLTALIDELKLKYPEGSAAPGYPADKERLLIDALRKGDKPEAEKILSEVLAILVFSNADHFSYIQYRALELAVMLTRSGINSGTGADMESNARFLKQIQEAKTVEDLTAVLHGIVENITGRITLFRGIPHASAMLKAEQHIREHFSRKVSLNEISRIAGLSAPYFSTIFKEEMGENFSCYINRLRVEKSTKLLLETDLSLKEISGACGFEDQSWFSKIFKSFTGISPAKYRSRGGMAQKVLHTGE